MRTPFLYGATLRAAASLLLAGMMIAARHELAHHVGARLGRQSYACRGGATRWWNGWPLSVDHSVREVLRGHQLSIDIQLEGRHALVERAERNLYDPAELGEGAVGLTIHDQSRPVERSEEHTSELQSR